MGHRGTRREYTCIGDTCNLSARLMGLSKYGWKKSPMGPGIHIEYSVYHSAKDEPRLGFEDLGVKQVKGKSVPIHCYKPNLKTKIYKVYQHKSKDRAQNAATLRMMANTSHKTDKNWKFVYETLER